jgi:uncharacterized membrane protein
MNLIKQKLHLLPETILGLVVLWLRLINLGYSDYQGDEIKALFLPLPNQSISNFLLTQRKGPIQFLITVLLKVIDPTYDNRLLLRLPFALAGIFTVLFFYKLVKLHFGRKVALYSSFFLATNGFFVAFSRIVQYQSFVILFAVLTLYVLTLSTHENAWKTKGIYWGFVFWALSILSHYDGVFIAPFVAALLLINYKKWKNIPTIRHFVRAAVLFALILSVFYVPFIFEISDKTKDYWQGRLSGTGGKISSSKYLFQVYHPIYVIHAYMLLGILGGIHLGIKAIKDSKNRICLGGLLLWFLAPFVFLELVVNIPGTHIINYLLPALVILGVGTALIEKSLERLFGNLTSTIVSITGLIILAVFLFLQTHAIFVDHTKEYPWQNENFFVWELHKPTPVFHLSMFGFPYYRHWNKIGDFVRNSENNGYYSTNERKSIARYHIPFEKDSNSAGHFVHILNSQSFTDEILSEKPKYWAQNYDPVLTFVKNGKDIARVYYIPAGTLEEIQAMGY